MKFDEVVEQARSLSMEGVGDADYEDYELWLGSFEGENFKWKVISKFNDFNKAFKAFKDFCDKQASYSQEELKEVWSSPRLDIELRQGNKMLNWMGLYSRKVDKDLTAEREASKKKKEEPKQEQVIDYTLILLSG